MNDTSFWYGMVISIGLFVVLPILAYLIVAGLKRDRPEPVNWVAYHDSLRPLYTTHQGPPPQRLKQRLGQELYGCKDEDILEVKDWGFAVDVYLKDGTVKMIDTVSGQR